MPKRAGAGASCNPAADRAPSSHPAFPMIFPAITEHPGYMTSWIADLPGLIHRAFNGSLVKFDGHWVLAERIEYFDGRSSIQISRINRTSWRRSGPLWLVFQPDRAGTFFEDPRLFIAADQLYLSFVSVCYAPHGDGVFSQRLARVDLAKLALEEVEISDGRGGKNFTFFDHDGKIGWISRPKFRWPWGEPSGGSPAVFSPRHGAWLAIGHAYVAEVHRGRRYNMFAMLLDPVRRAITHVSKNPLWWGSTDDFTIVYPRFFHWAPIDVFPSGLCAAGNDWFVTMGVNDSATALVRLRDVDLDLIPVGQIPSEAPAQLAGAVTSIGSVRVRSISHQPIVEPGGPYRRGDEFLLSVDRAHALGKQIEVLA